jgi:hypothetical protein
MIRTRWLCSLLAGVVLVGGTPARAAWRDLPTYARDETGSIDAFVLRGHLDLPDESLRAGDIGVLLPTFDRESLFLAYRALRLGAAEQAKQARTTQAPAADQIPEKGIPVWLEARRALGVAAPTVQPVNFRDFGGDRVGSFANCPDGTFLLAAQTLKGLSGNAKVSTIELQEWLAAQDGVFAMCSAGPAASPSLPVPLDAKHSLYLRQLRQYQIATAHFYLGHYDEALTAFDATAADKTHPMRAWASLAAARSILRKASMDDSLRRRLTDIEAKTPNPDQRRAAYAQAWRSNEERLEAAQAQIAARVAKILAESSLSSVHGAAANLKVQATLWLTPALAYADLTAALGRFDADFEVSGQLARWADLGNRLFDGRGRADLIDKLRRDYEFFDWIRTIQGCNDNPASPNFTGRCREEHAHAFEMWKLSQRNTWLLATLMTATRYVPEIEAALTAGRSVSAGAAEYPSVRYHMARLLRMAGRVDEARSLLAETSTNATASISARNLFAQERLALARNLDEAMPNLLRSYAGRQGGGKGLRAAKFGLGADGAALLNRQTTTQDLLHIAGMPTVPSELREQMLVATWWRADLIGNRSAANSAAQSAGKIVPELRDAVRDYLQSGDDEARQLVLAKAALKYRISPLIGHESSLDFAQRRRVGSADWWCSFKNSGYGTQARAERSPSQLPQFAVGSSELDAELAALEKRGTGVDWLAEIAFRQARKQASDPYVRPMLQAIVAGENLECASAEGEKLAAQAKDLLAALPMTEQQVRSEYDRIAAKMDKREYRISHILVRSEAEARTVLAALAKGSRFEDLAKERSIDPSSKDKGGDLGWAAASVYVGPFAAAVRAKDPPGLIEAPVTTPFGWHVIRVVDSRALIPPPFEAVRAKLEQRMREQPNLP